MQYIMMGTLQWILRVLEPLSAYERDETTPPTGTVGVDRAVQSILRDSEYYSNYSIKPSAQLVIKQAESVTVTDIQTASRGGVGVFSWRREGGREGGGGGEVTVADIQTASRGGVGVLGVGGILLRFLHKQGCSEPLGG